MADDLVTNLRLLGGTGCAAADTITRLRTELAAAERVIVAKDDALIHIEEYWNRSETDGAMSDALHEIIGAAQDALALTPDKLADMRLVPVVPIEAMWSGLARDIIMWLRMHDGHTPRHLFDHLERIGRTIPQWLRDEPEMKHLDHVPSKGTIAVIIYRAMIGEGE